MTPSEENFTAWIDGRLSAKEAEAFEKSLEGSPALDEAHSQRDEARKLGSLLRNHWEPAKLTNADFFTHQLLTQIEASEPGRLPEVSASSRRPVSIRRLLGLVTVGYGVAALAAFAILQPVGSHEVRGYYAEVLNAKPGDASISANAFYSKKANVTVLWIDGLDRISGEEW